MRPVYSEADDWDNKVCVHALESDKNRTVHNKQLNESWGATNNSYVYAGNFI